MTLIDRVFLISVPKISIISEQIKADLPAVGNTRSRFFICGGEQMKEGKLQHDPYMQRCMKIITAETAQEAETIVNGLFLEAAMSGGDLPDIQVTPQGDGYAIIIFNDFLIS